MRWQAFDQTILVKSTSSPRFRVIGFNFLFCFGKGASDPVKDSVLHHVSDSRVARFCRPQFQVSSIFVFMFICSAPSCPSRHATLFIVPAVTQYPATRLSARSCSTLARRIVLPYQVFVNSFTACAHCLLACLLV